MLVLGRKADERVAILVDGKVIAEVVVAYIHGSSKVGLGFIAGDGVEIARGELLEEDPPGREVRRQEPFPKLPRAR